MTGELYAMKSILKALALKQNKHRQVIAEKDALFACDHHCIIRYRASFSDAQHLYLLMELALGGELFSLLDDQASPGPMPNAHAQYALPIAQCPTV